MITAGGRGASAPATVDGSGNFRIEGAPSGKVAIRGFLRTGTGSRTSELVQLETENGRTYTVEVEFREHNTVRGRVTRRGVPLRSGTIMFLPRVARVMTSAPIDTNGNYEATGVQSGEHDITIAAMEGQGSRYSITRTITQSQTLDIDLNPASLSGRVVNASTGEAIVGALIELERRAGTEPITGSSAADGRVLMENLPSGSFTLRVTKEGFGSYVTTQTFTDGATATLDARLTPSEGLSLRILDGRTNRPVQAWLVVHAADGTVPYNNRPYPRADGSLLLPLAAGTYRINILPNGLSMSYITATSPGSETVTLMPGGTLEITRPGNTRARILAGDGSVYNVSLAGTTGEFRISGGNNVTDMAPGSYTLQLIGDDGRVTQSVPFTIQVGQTTKLTL